jgi:hypothetical protein
MLRPAGYGLSRRLIDLDESYTMFLLGGFCTALFSVRSGNNEPTDFWGPTLHLVVLGGISAVLTMLAWRNLQAIRRARLGLAGEQVMGELLQPLWAKGYQVFHDVMGAEKWNIDHVVVGPAGVFAIETKTRTKKPGPKGEPGHRVTFDGKSLRFPGFVDSRALDQAKRNAKWLGDWLSKATGEPVTAQAIVVLPGWLVDRTARDSSVSVLSGKEMVKFIAEGTPRLSEKLIRQVAHQLDQKCRDVEF